MKITGRPEFHFVLDKTTLDLIHQLSVSHYDAKCRGASRLGGFIYGWTQRMDDNAEAECTATFQELDLLTKICEAIPQLRSPEQRAKLRSFRDQISAALRRANVAVLGWRIDL